MTFHVMDCPTPHNVVLVQKKNEKWRVCVDFTDLYKACPKDSYALPQIDLLVDSNAWHKLLSFMEAYFGYNQIKMYEPDKETTSFVLDRGTYCYKVMPFGLKTQEQRTSNSSIESSRKKSMTQWRSKWMTWSLRAKKRRFI